jgi:amino acid adenylation domain-containing protein
MMLDDATRIAQQVAALPPGTRRLFLDKLRASNLSFGELPIIAAPRDQPLPLSPAQQGLWWTWRMDPTSSAYHLPGLLRFRGPLNADVLSACVSALVARHEILRTVFQPSDDGNATQVVIPASTELLRRVDWRHETSEVLEADIQQWAESSARVPFRLDAEPPFRATLLQTRNEHLLLLVFHHIAADGRSLQIFIDSLVKLYTGTSSAATQTGAPSIQYADYAVWQRNWLEAGEADRQLAYWRARLGDEYQELDLPFDRRRTPEHVAYAGRHELRFSSTLSERLRGTARSANASLYMLLLALFKLVLHRVTGSDKIRVGAPFDCRDRAETQQLIGYVANLHVLQTVIDAGQGFDALLASVRSTVLDAQEHRHLPFDILVQELRVERRPGVHPLFQVKCTELPELQVAREFAGVSLRIQELPPPQSHFDLSFDFIDRPSGLRGVFSYDAGLFDAQTIERIASWLVCLAEQVTADISTPLRNLQLADSSAVIAGGTRIAEHAGILALWSACMLRSPDAVAVRQEDRVASYQQLERASERLARALVSHGVGAETRVGLHADRSIEFVLGMLAILKAGGTYVPLDPQLPGDRLAYQFKDSGAILLLTTSPPSWAVGTTVVQLDSALLSCEPVTGPGLPAPHPAQSAYVIYTSGSTGRPKGVVVTHAALANYVQSVLQRLDLPDAVNNLAMVSTVAADLGHTVLFGALCSGRTLHLVAHERVFDPDRFATYMREQQIDVLKIVPSHLRALLGAARAQDVLPRHALILGGEATQWPLLERIRSLRPECRVINHYGPTEATVGVFTQSADRALTGAGTLPIGVPLTNIHAYVLDAHLNPLSQGAGGELYLGGSGLARGYHERGGLTAERFVAHPFETGARLYRTGDRVKRLGDGSVEFLGRTDDQVKIHGHRVELREVASALKLHAEAKEAEVIARTGTDGHVRLCGYIVAHPGRAMDVARVRERLAAALPEYMVPSSLVVMVSLPLTANGKLDRKALPEPQFDNARAYEAPKGALEETLAALWSQVLGVDRVGRQDGFFELGGDSILVLKFIARARAKEIAVTPKQMFQHPTLSGLASELSSGRPAPAHEAVTIPVVGRSGPLPLSAAQSRQWFLWRLDEDSTAYHISAGLHLRGALNEAAVRSSFAALVDRHESLRTVFHVGADGTVEQQIRPPGSFELSLVDLNESNEATRADRVRAEARRIARTPFDLTTGPLFRAGLIRLSAQEHILVVAVHHIVADGWSMQILVDEFAQLYRACVSGLAPELQPLSVQYADYAAWQRKWLEAGEQDRQLAYWRNQLGAEHPVLQLSTDHPRTHDARYQAAISSFELPESLVQSLQQRAREHRSTLFTTLLAALQLLLHRYTGQAEIRIGSPSANRHHPNIQSVVGCFINTQVLSVNIDGRSTLHELLDQVRAMVVGAQEHQDLPFERLVEELQPERGPAHPLFQVLMDHQRKDHRDLAQLPGLTSQSFELGEQGASFDLWLKTIEHADGRVSVEWWYAVELFDADTIRRLGGHYLRVLTAIAERPQQRIRDLQLLDAVEQGQLWRWGRDERRSHVTEPLHRSIERHAQRRPDAIALTCGDTEVNYRELNRAANRLAHRLISAGVAPEARVGVLAERSIEMVVGILAVLKAGGAYVPLDPQYPPARLNFMVRDSGARWLLTHKAVAASDVDVTGVAMLDMDADVTNGPDRNPEVPLHGDNLAYVIYTSGSTGSPKGAQLTHSNVTRLLEATREWFNFDSEDVWTLFHSSAFDFSVWEIFGALCSGGRLVIVPHGVSRSPDEFLGLLRQQRVTVLNQTPSAFRQLMQLPSLYRAPALALRAVIFGGEALDARSLHPWIEEFGDSQPRLINMYGITETTVHVTYRPILQADLARSGSPIGVNIPDLGLHVLDPYLDPTPIGVAGELHVAGGGLARGYLQRAGLTSERFIADPFASEGGRLYRTGDLVRWNASGELEYLGRIDQQVKLRGFRIELGEIEAKLTTLPRVATAVVVVRDDDGDSRLIAYVVPTPEAPGSAAEVSQQWVSDLRSMLKASLPQHMVPAHIIALERLPLTPNGKLDRRALPRPDGVRVDRDFTAPASPVERRLAALWQELLRVDEVGMEDNFFELGGHSLLATQVVARIRSEYRIDLPLRTLFVNGELGPFASAVQAAIESSVATPELPLQRMERTGDVPLSYAQQRLWFLWNLAPDAAAYNMATAIRLVGQLHLPALRHAFDSVLARHEALRTTFHGDPTQSFQRVEPPAGVHIAMIDLQSAGTNAERDAEARAQASREALLPFDLRQGPLLRVTLMRLGESDHVLLVNLHHIVSDGWSMSVLVREFAQFYDRYRRNDTTPLAPLPIQYADYAVWQRQWLDGGAMEDQLRYWREELAQPYPEISLAGGAHATAPSSHAGGVHEFLIDRTLTDRLRDHARKHDVTLFVVLLATFAVALAQRTEQRRFRIGTDIANRNRPEIEGLVGFFVNQLVLNVDLTGITTLSGLLQRMHVTVLGAFDHQDVPFDRLVNALKPQRRSGRAPYFNIKLIYQESPPAMPRLEGLEVTEFPIERSVAELDLVAAFSLQETGLRGRFEYSSEVSSRESIVDLSEQMRAAFALIADQSDVSLQTLSDELMRVQQEILTQRARLYESGIRASRRRRTRGASVAQR